MRSMSVLVSALLAVSSVAIAKDKDLSAAIAGSHRTPDLVSRDSARHPQEELEFFGIKPTMTVVEISPGGGYWTEILAPYLKDKGTFYTTVSPRSLGERAVKAADAWQAKLDANKAVYGKVKVAEFGTFCGVARNVKATGTPRTAVVGPLMLAWRL